MSTIKNAHSPAGMSYSTSGTRLVNLTDCPRCKYGTLDRRTGDRRTGEKNRVQFDFFQCADCGAKFKPEQIQNQKQK